MNEYADFIPAVGHDDDISAIVKQMKIIHQDGYTREELIEFRPTIWKHLLETARSVVQVLRASHAEPATLPSEVRHFRVSYFRYITEYPYSQTWSAL